MALCGDGSLPCMRDLLPIICSGQASKGGRIQLIHGSKPRNARSRPPDRRGVATPRRSARNIIRFGMTDHARGGAVTSSIVSIKDFGSAVAFLDALSQRQEPVSPSDSLDLPRQRDADWPLLPSACRDTRWDGFDRIVGSIPPPKTIILQEFNSNWPQFGNSPTMQTEKGFKYGLRPHLERW